MVHAAAGLTIAADRRIPGLAVSAPDRPPDVIFHLDTPAPWARLVFQHHYAAELTDDLGRPTVTVGRARSGFHFQYADDTHVWIDDAASEVWCTWPREATLEDTATYLTGPVLGFLLRRRGMFALHASAVRVGHAALVLVGPHGSGKSTTATAFGLRGCAVIADDIVRVARTARGWMAEPFGGLLRLWPDAVRLVLGGAAQLPRITPTWDKRALEIGTCSISGAGEPVPIGAVAFLDEREDSPDAPRLEAVGGAEAVVRLATHSSASHLLDDNERAREFAILARLTAHLACTRAVAARSERSFPAFIDLLHDWANERCSNAA